MEKVLNALDRVDADLIEPFGFDVDQDATEFIGHAPVMALAVLNDSGAELFEPSFGDLAVFVHRLMIEAGVFLNLLNPVELTLRLDLRWGV